MTEEYDNQVGQSRLKRAQAYLSYLEGTEKKDLEIIRQAISKSGLSLVNYNIESIRK